MARQRHDVFNVDITPSDVVAVKEYPSGDVRTVMFVPQANCYVVTWTYNKEV